MGQDLAQWVFLFNKNGLLSLYLRLGKSRKSSKLEELKIKKIPDP